MDKNSFNGGSWVEIVGGKWLTLYIQNNLTLKEKRIFMWSYGLHIISPSVLFQALESSEDSFSFACSAEVGT